VEVAVWLTILLILTTVVIVEEGILLALACIDEVAVPIFEML
jgi:hypothetical protein